MESTAAAPVVQTTVSDHIALVTQEPFLFDDTTMDAAIYAGDGHWPGAVTTHLMAETLVPVCSPSLLAKMDGPVTIEAMMARQKMHCALKLCPILLAKIECANK